MRIWQECSINHPAPTQNLRLKHCAANNSGLHHYPTLLFVHGGSRLVGRFWWFSSLRLYKRINAACCIAIVLIASNVFLICFLVSLNVVSSEAIDGV